MAVAIFLSYSLQFYVPVNIIEPFVQRQFETPRGKDLAATALRIVLVTFTCKNYKMFYRNIFKSIFLLLSYIGCVYTKFGTYNITCWRNKQFSFSFNCASNN